LLHQAQQNLEYLKESVIFSQISQRHYFEDFFLNILLLILNEREGMHANTQISHGTEMIIFLLTIMHSSVKSSYFCS